MQKAMNFNISKSSFVVINTITNMLRNQMQPFGELDAGTNPLGRGNGSKLLQYLDDTKFNIAVVICVNDAVKAEEDGCANWLGGVYALLAKLLH